MEKILHTDVFIAGAGAAGIAAAYAAAECGMKVTVAEKNSYPGGRATASAVGTICGLYLRSEEKLVFAMQGFPKVFAERLMQINKKQPVKFAEGLWFIPCHPVDFEKTAAEFLSHPRINVMYNATVVEAEVSERKINSVTVQLNGEDLKIIPAAVIDCSGDGVLCSILNHATITDTEYQAAAIVFSLRNISSADEYQLSLSLMKQIASAIEKKEVPEYFSLVSVVPSSFSSGSVMMKSGLPWKVYPDERNAVELKARQLVQDMFGFMKSSVHGFENAEIDWIAREVGVRTGMRVKGKNILADHDVLNCRKHEEGICNGAWPIEFWRTGNKRVEMTYFAEKDFYTIPPGCLQSGELENIFFAGKIISAEEKAIASARVIGTCMGTGFAAGVMASFKAGKKSMQEATSHIQKILQLG